jgi:N-acetyltransferase 10
VTVACGWGEGKERVHLEREDFRRRVLRLLPSLYAKVGVWAALQLVEGGGKGAVEGEVEGEGGLEGGAEARTRPETMSALSMEELSFLLSSHDLKRLHSYSQSLTDPTVVADLLPVLVQLFFQNRLPSLPASPSPSAPASLPPLYAAVLLGLGLQGKGGGEVSTEVGLPTHQVQAVFNKAVRRLAACLRAMEEEEVEGEMAAARAEAWKKGAREGGREGGREGELVSLPIRLQAEMEDGAKEVQRREQARGKEGGKAEGVLKALGLMEYAVKGTEEEWEKTLREEAGVLEKRGVVQMKSQRIRPVKSVLDGIREEGGGEERGRKGRGGRGGGRGGGREGGRGGSISSAGFGILARGERRR